MHDIRYALRVIRTHPGYAAIVVGTLALALGATTTLYSAADATLLAPLPVPGGDRVVSLFDRQPQFDGPSSASWPEVKDWRAQARSLAAVAAERTQSMSWVGAGEPERVTAAFVSEDYLKVFALAPAAGRGFSAEEHRKGGPRVALLGNGFWQRAFGGDAQIVGKTVRLDGAAFTVVGILPPGVLEAIRGPRDVLVPLEPRLPSEERGEHYLAVFGRLAPGVTLAAARAELETLGPALDLEKSGHRIGIQSLREWLYGKAVPSLLVLLGAALFVLVIAGANVTSIMLARMHGRAHELGVRAALGASRARLARQLLTESLLLALAGGALGLLLALWSKDLLLALWPTRTPRPEVVPLAWRTLLVSTGVAALVGALVGAAPALRGSRADLATTLRAGTVPRSGRLRSALVVIQHAVAVMLLVGAGLLGTSLIHLLSVRPGFDPTGVITMNVSLPAGRYPDDASRRGFYEEVAERLRAVPGVEAASAISEIPFGRSYTTGSFTIEGRPELPSEKQPHTTKMLVEADYFHTMRIPILAGRGFDPSERRPLVVINKTFADRYFPGESALGHRIDVCCGPAEIVGIAADVRRESLDEPPELQTYVNFAQTLPWASFVVRASGDPTRLFGTLKAQVYAVDPERPVYAIGTMDEAIAGSAAQRRVVALMIAGFAAVALLLAALGIYGVLSYSVSQRTREIGLRMALGARGGTVLALVLGEGMRLALAGTALGLVGAALLARLFGAMLYQVSATDPRVYVAVTAVLVGVGAAACLVPAWRAARVDPMTALRAE